MNRVSVPADAGPLFVALAADDPLFGDHGFGLGRPGTTTTLVMDEFRLWLASRGMLGANQ